MLYCPDFSGEFSSGGAAYIPTGRSLAIERQPFSVLYSSFAAVCFYPGLELALLLCLAPLSSPALALPPIVVVFASIVPVSLLWAPSLFNPRGLELWSCLDDMRAWGAWLVDDGPKGWAAFHTSLLDKKKGSATYDFLLPSKEQLLCYPLLIIAHEVLRPHLGEFARVPTMLTLAVPIAPGLTVGMVIGALALIQPTALKSSWLLPALSLVCTATIVGEASALSAVAPDLNPAETIAVWMARYFAWRALFNALAFIPTHQTQGGRVTSLIWYTGSALAFLADVILGLLVQLPLLVCAAIPCSASLQLTCLFYTTQRHLAGSQQEHMEDRLSINAFEIEKHTLRKTGSKRGLFARAKTTKLLFGGRISSQRDSAGTARGSRVRTSQVGGNLLWAVSTKSDGQRKVNDFIYGDGDTGESNVGIHASFTGRESYALRLGESHRASHV